MVGEQKDEECYLYTYYYSDRCPYSRQLHQRLLESDFVKFCKLVNIDEQEPKIPLTHVPTLIVDNGLQLVGKNAFEWLDSEMSRSFTSKGNGVKKSGSGSFGVKRGGKNNGASFGQGDMGNTHGLQLMENNNQSTRNEGGVQNDMDARLSALQMERDKQVTHPIERS